MPACRLAVRSNIMYAKSFLALYGNDRLTGARTVQTALTTAIHATCVAVPCSTILNTTPNARGLNTGTIR